jgi:hypothetical protein
MSLTLEQLVELYRSDHLMDGCNRTMMIGISSVPVVHRTPVYGAGSPQRCLVGTGL